MKTKLIKITALILLVATSVLLGACANTKEDQAKIISYLDRRFGKGTYTIKQEIRILVFTTRFLTTPYP